MNLLSDPLLRIETPTGIERVSLPTLLAALGSARIVSIPGLQRHQEDAFHVFLCYVGGAVLARAGRTDEIQTPAFWIEGLRELAHGEEDAWSLVVEDPTRPAFMQPPVPKVGDFNAFTPKAETPDALDLLPTARNHDVKSSRATSAEPEDWTYALISLQTMSGYFGQGNYGIVRMNSGFASRSVVGLIYDGGISMRWRRDTRRLLELRGDLLGGPWRYRSDGEVLTWHPPWDLKTSLALSCLDPFFVEVCRAVRLVAPSGRIMARGASTKAPRIAGKDANGVLGDPWTPINLTDKKKGQSALTVPATGFSPSLLRDLIFADGYRPADMQLPEPGHEDQPCRVVASVLVRGQGTTDGFHSASIPVPARTAHRLFRPGMDRDRLARLSKTALNDAGLMLNRVLRPALLSLLEAGPAQVDFGRREVGNWSQQAARAFSEAWSDGFFPWLWQSADTPDDHTARLGWLRKLREHAEMVLFEATDRYPGREARRYRARVQAEGLFRGALFKVFPDLKETRNVAEHNA